MAGREVFCDKENYKFVPFFHKLMSPKEGFDY